MKYINKLLQERTKGERHADFEAQDAAVDSREATPKSKRTETQKSERATLDAGSTISRRPKSGEKPRTQISTDKQIATGKGSKAKKRAEKLVSQKGSKAKKRAKKLVSHTVYQDMGYLMAESLGLVSERRFDYMQDTPEGEAATRKAQKDTAAKQRKANAEKIKAAKGGAVTTTPRGGNPETIKYPKGGRP